MRIIVVNVNTSQTMTAVIEQAARRYASAETQITALRPYFGPEAVDCNFESYLSAVAVMDRVLAYDGPYDAVVLAGFGEHGRDGLAELIEQPVVEICEASAHVAMMIGRAYSVVTTLQRSVPASRPPWQSRPTARRSSAWAAPAWPGWRRPSRPSCTSRWSTASERPSGWPRRSSALACGRASSPRTRCPSPRRSLAGRSRRRSACGHCPAGRRERHHGRPDGPGLAVAGR